jgi:hypothetical protein
MASPFTFVDDPASYKPADTLVVRVPWTARGKEKLLGMLAQRLQFPSYFGWNWDALEECLRDLSWLDVPQVSIVHESLPLSPRGNQLQTYLHVLAAAISFRSEKLPKLHAVFPVHTREQIEALAPVN